jgi:DNA-binding NtrC family response regulator
MATARILIVDHEAAVLGIISIALKDRYEVLATSSPRIALEIVRTKPQIDLILSDVEMPEIQGPDLLNAVNKISPSTAVLLMSGNEAVANQLPEDISFLRKPLSYNELLASIEADYVTKRGPKEVLLNSIRTNRPFNTGLSSELQKNPS